MQGGGGVSERVRKAWEVPSAVSRPVGEPVRIDTTVAHSARMYDYYLGGKDHYQVDRDTAEIAARSWQAVRIAVRENRSFLGRAVRHLVRDHGITQFLDIGAGLPSAGNVHEIAQAEDPSCRVVYVDNDPIVLAHARSLLIGTPEGKTAYVHADLREPAAILDDPAVRDTLDRDRPVALMLVAILHFIVDEQDPGQIVRHLMEALPSGSFLVASHVTPEHDPDGVHGLEQAYRNGGVPAQARTRDAFTALAFDGLELLDPGVTLVSEWRPDGDGPRPPANQVNWYGGIARKP
ncbi:SAM-dependent methyltransferase [Actinomadura montaniterrae]|uniref:SAM-dependent methyltransferase n=1 Tax=Actinomadura montaniterrae TaxID=1803903 RepID=A0A6L3VNT8_9ACTN|nr:SAM-dependent methyltransferase [Actinomadura montaniterrae]